MPPTGFGMSLDSVKVSLRPGLMTLRRWKAGIEVRYIISNSVGNQHRSSGGCVLQLLFFRSVTALQLSMVLGERVSVTRCHLLRVGLVQAARAARRAE